MFSRVACDCLGCQIVMQDLEELAIVGTTNREALLHGERDWLEMFRVQGLGFVLSAKGWCE